MPTLDDLPILPQLAAPVGGDLIAVCDVSAAGAGPSKIKKLPLNSLMGLTATDVTSAAAGTLTLSTRLLVVVSGTTSTITIPAASGDLREFTIINGGSGTATLATTATANEIISSGDLTADADDTILTGVVARYLSNGTNWYRVQ